MLANEWSISLTIDTMINHPPTDHAHEAIASKNKNTKKSNDLDECTIFKGDNTADLWSTNDTKFQEPKLHKF